MDANQYELDAELDGNHWWWVARRKILTQLLERFVDVGSNPKILEVGCSTGSNLEMLQRFGDVQALEMHEMAVDFCRRRFPDLRIHQGAVPCTLDDAFDVICLFDVLEHIEDDAGALDWIDQRLLPGGMLFLTVPAYEFLWSPHDDLAHHHRRYTRANLLGAVGRRFDVRYATYFNAHLFPAIAAVRLAQRLLPLPWTGERDKSVGGAGAANHILKAVFAAERMWLPWASLPFGVSIFAAARKRDDR